MEDERYVVARRCDMVIRIVDAREFYQPIVRERRGRIVARPTMESDRRNTILQDLVIVLTGVGLMLALSWALVFSMQLVLNKL
jgi:hypothetical protein